jgi:hypothetical protein
VGLLATVEVKEGVEHQVKGVGEEAGVGTGRGRGEGLEGVGEGRVSLQEMGVEVEVVLVTVELTLLPLLHPLLYHRCDLKIRLTSSTVWIRLAF